MNMHSKERIFIIGGGLNGLTLAYLLSKSQYNLTILEASPRLGGRIYTKMGELNTPLELGATWFSDMHQNLLALLDELGVKRFFQFSQGISLFQTKSFEPTQSFYVPASESPSYRMVGGTQKMIEILSKKLPEVEIHLNASVCHVKDFGGEMLIETKDGKKWVADKVVLCMPPHLVGVKISFSPYLPNDIFHLLPTVHTWMAGSIKFVLEYEKAFWRENGYSGMLYSHAGIVTEMYDHTNFEASKFGFTGFLNSGAASYSQEVRKELVLQQLALLLGSQMLLPITYDDKVWTDEWISGGTQIIQRPHQNNGHPLLQESYMNGKLYFSGTETSKQFGGYMEGAIISALNVANKIQLVDFRPNNG